MNWVKDTVIDKPLNEVKYIKRVYDKKSGEVQKLITEVIEFGWDCEDIIL